MRTEGFNPRTHMGCDPLSFGLLRRRPRFQSTHPHGVRQDTLCDVLQEVRVSIHAPTWGATDYAPNDAPTINVSIHAPTWGATITLLILCITINVSIHAPTWGATQKHNVVVRQY